MKALAPDTRESALDIASSLFDFVKEDCQVRPDPSVAGTWLVVDQRRGEALIVYTNDYDAEEVCYDSALRYFRNLG